MKRFYRLLPFLLGPTLLAAEPERITIPKGTHILLDGRVEADEWSDAREVRVSTSVRVYLKRTEEYLYIAVKPDEPAMFGMDIYFDRGEATLLNLHASAKLGERQGKEGAWPEWSWWNNRGWTANASRGTDFAQREFLPDEAKEFQISLKKLGAHKTLWFSLDLQSAEGTQSLPEKGMEKHDRRWLQLAL